VVSIEPLGREPVWDIVVEGTHNFIGNRIFAHNTYLSGNVGVGTTAPVALLDLKKTTVTDKTLVSNSALNIIAPTYLNGAYWPAISFSVGDNVPTNTRGAIWAQMTNSGDYLHFSAGPPAQPGVAGPMMTIRYDGNVGIGTTSPTLGPLQMGSGAYVTAGGVWTNASSREYKKESPRETRSDSCSAWSRPNRPSLSSRRLRPNP